MTVRTRALSSDDAPALARLVRDNRRFLAPWEPLREERWFTEAGQRDEVAAVLERAELGLVVPRVVLDGGEVAGRISLDNVVRGAFQSCSAGSRAAVPADRRAVAGPRALPAAGNVRARSVTGPVVVQRLINRA